MSPLDQLTFEVRCEAASALMSRSACWSNVKIAERTAEMVRSGGGLSMVSGIGIDRMALCSECDRCPSSFEAELDLITSELKALLDRKVSMIEGDVMSSREKRLARMKRYRERNREVVLARQKRWRERKKREMATDP